MATLENRSGQFNSPEIADAILALDPTATFIINGEQTYANVEWRTYTNKPTEAACNAKLAELVTAYNNLNYSRQRYVAYKTIVEQLDLLYADMVAGKLDTTGSWATHIKSVKDAFPKP